MNQVERSEHDVTEEVRRPEDVPQTSEMLDVLDQATQASSPVWCLKEVLTTDHSNWFLLLPFRIYQRCWNRLVMQ